VTFDPVSDDDADDYARPSLVVGGGR